MIIVKLKVFTIFCREFHEELTGKMKAPVVEN